MYKIIVLFLSCFFMIQCTESAKLQSDVQDYAYPLQSTADKPPALEIN